MSNPIPSQIALDTISNGTLADGSVVQANDAAIQVAVNQIIAALSNGPAGQFLQSVDASDVQWGNAADKSSASKQQFTGALGLTSDVTLTRSAPGQVTLGGTSSKGNIVCGASSTNVGGPATVTPDAASLFNRYNFINASGTFTIAAPLNPPTGAESAVFYLCLNNSSGGTVTLSFDPIYSGISFSPPSGQGTIFTMVWNVATSKWVSVSETTLPGL